MKLPYAIVLSTFILAMAIVIGTVQPAESQRRADGFMIATDGRQFVWRVNTTTGSVSYCVRRDDSIDEGYIAKRPPYCSAGSPPVAGGAQ